jgi:uncharacterized protein (DUF697 family)
MATKNQKVAGIITAAAASAAGVGAGLAQLPGSDAPVICGLQTGMIVAIAQVHGVNLTKTAAADLLLTFGAAMGGRFISQVLVGWIPGWGNTINAATAASITTGIGWAANQYFDDTEENSASKQAA